MDGGGLDRDICIFNESLTLTIILILDLKKNVKQSGI